MKFKVLILNIVLILILNVCFPIFAFAENKETDSIQTQVVTNEPEIVSEAGFLMEVKSGNVLYSKNSSERFILQVLLKL